MTIERRSFIKATAAGLATVGMATMAERAGAAPAIGKSRDVVVVGAGVFGAWTAYHLQKQGIAVTLVDSQDPGSENAASGGLTRMMQALYGSRPEYIRMTIESAKRWTQHEQEWGEKVVIPTDRVKIWPTAQMERAQRDQATLKSFGVGTEILNADELRRRWPQIAVGDDEMAIWFDGKGFSGSAGSSIILARKATQALVREFRKAGGKFVKGAPQRLQGSGAVDALVLTDGQKLSAGAYLFAIGRHMRELFHDVLRDEFRVERRFEYYVETPKDGPFNHPKMPIWGFFSPSWYGFPDLDGMGLKIAHGSQTYPDVPGMWELVKRRFPTLPHRLKALTLCQDLYRPTENFLVERHPGFGNVWLAGGGNGHAFKMGPVLGSYIAGRMLGGAGDPLLDKLFLIRNERRENA